MKKATFAIAAATLFLGLSTVRADIGPTDSIDADANSASIPATGLGIVPNDIPDTSSNPIKKEIGQRKSPKKRSTGSTSPQTAPSGKIPGATSETQSGSTTGN